MIYNLVGNPTFSLELKRHRELLDQWLAVGDMGSEAEPIANLKANGDGKKGGEGQSWCPGQMTSALADIEVGATCGIVAYKWS